MFMRDRIRKLRRDFLVGRVVANGEKLRRYKASRAGVDAGTWPDDCAYLDGVIGALERRHRLLLSKIREV